MLKQVQYCCILLLYPVCVLCNDKGSDNLENKQTRGGKKPKPVKQTFITCKHSLSCGKLLSEQRKWPHDQHAPMKRLQLKLSEERKHVLTSRKQNARKRCRWKSLGKSRDTGAGEKQTLQLSITKRKKPVRKSNCTDTNLKRYNKPPAKRTWHPENLATWSRASLSEPCHKRIRKP